MHERHAQHVGMHVVESVELIHGSAVLQSTHLDQIRALCDVCATCAASRTIAHSSVWSVSECGDDANCWRRRRMFSRHHRGQTATADDQSVRWLMCVMHVAMRGRGRVRRIGRARRRRSQLLQGYRSGIMFMSGMGSKEPARLDGNSDLRCALVGLPARWW